ncbi:hypothetical protein AAEU32_04965 [Pseudoalteromonas sp. SSDWG2]|uniref:hypothetical protein n=1 Tax=Pseudoalteromonas sp. SSDWG2 TaxID=3139391 RepID=UPI003BABA719
MEDKNRLARAKRIARNKMKYRDVDFVLLRQRIYQDVTATNQALHSKPWYEGYLSSLAITLAGTASLLLLIVV